MNPAEFAAVDIPSTRLLDNGSEFSSKTYTSRLSFDEIKSLPGIIRSQPIYKFSPQPGIILYQRCLGDIVKLNYGEVCYSEYEFVVYDYELQQEIAVLRDTPYLRPEPRVDFHFSFYWSSNGRYIVYRTDNQSTGEKIVYDLLENKYIDTTAIQIDGSNYYLYPHIRWSSDEQSIAALISPLKGENTGLRKIAIFELETGVFRVLPDYYDVKAGEWDWLPDSTGLAMMLEDNSLLQVNLDGSKTIIAENVQRITTTYNPRS